MFRLTYGVSQAEFYATQKTASERGIPAPAAPQSDDESGFTILKEDAFDDAKMHIGWQSGEKARDAARKAGVATIFFSRPPISIWP